MTQPSSGAADSDGIIDVVASGSTPHTINISYSAGYAAIQPG